MLLCQPSVAAKPPNDRDRMALVKAPVRIVPLWRDLKVQLLETLELQKGMPEPTEGSPILLSDRPSIIFRESCHPDSMPLVFFIRSSDVESYLASFTWKRGKGSKVRAWIYSSEDETTVTEREYSITRNPRVLMIVHVSHLHLLVAFCDDIHLRFFGDYTQGFQLLSEMSSPYSITSLCSNSETGELVTGAIGIVTFWSFVMEEAPCVNIEQEVFIASGEFVHFLRVEPEWGALIALCENNIRVYNYKTKVQICNFQVSQGVSLTCCTSNCAQGFLYTGDLAGDITVWDFVKGNLVNQFKAHLSAITSIISRMSVHTLMTASLDGLLKEWNLTTCEQLRRVDIGEEVFQMQFINEQTFFLRTKYTFSIRTVNNFYQLFNRSKSILKKLQRVQCGSDKARILAATEDGVVRFLSPVTGEMLFVTWPFQLLEKALDYVYDPDQEELLVTLGTSDIYVMDTAKNPCPVKYILHTADSIDDKVLCLAYSRLDLNGRTSSFIFSGFKSGKVRTVTQNLYRMGGRRIHNGNVLALSSLSASGNLSYHSRESSYLCSYGLDDYIILSDVILKKNNLLEVVPMVSILSVNCRINHLLLIPGYICVLTDQNRVRLWRQAALVPDKKNPFWKETDAMHSTSITSFDYCHTLSLLVTGGSDGSVRIWDILGQMLVEFDTTLKFSRVCFANQRGDLIVGFNMNIYFIPCVSYLPNKHLSMLATRSVRDDVVECPLPFMTPFLLSFDIVFVPKYRQVGKQAKKFERLEPINNHKEVVLEKGLAKVLTFIAKEASSLPGPDFYGLTPDVKELRPEFAVEYRLLSRPTLGKRHAPAEPPLAPPPYRGLPPLSKIVPLHRRIPFQAGRSWPIAPDGYVPNSVIRAQLFPTGTPTSLECPLIPSRDPLPMRKLVKIQLQDWDSSDVEKARKKKAEKLKRPTIEGRRRDLLSEIVTKPWLRHKPSDTSLPSVIKAIINIMDDVPYSTYLLCTSALVQLSESYELPTPVQEQAFDRLIQDTNHKEVRMRLAAWEALGKMDLLTDQEVVPLARALLDENKKVRDLARSLLDSVAGITDKFVLKKEMQRMAGASMDDLPELSRSQIEIAFPRRVRAAGIIAETQVEAFQALSEESERLLVRVEDQLTANLFLMTESPNIESSRYSRPPRFRRRALSQGAQEEIAKPDSHLEARARWLGLFARTDKLKSQAAAMKQLKGEKLRKIRPAHGKHPGLLRGMHALDGSPVSSSSSPSPSLSSSVSGSSILSSSSSGISSGSGSVRLDISSSTWQGSQRSKKKVKVKEKPEEIKLPPALSQVVRKLPKVHKRFQPILLQRRDTRTQLYTEMLKQKVKKEPVVAITPIESRQEIASVPLKPSPSAVPAPTPAPTPASTAGRGTLIDPNEQYNTDRTKWRNDLYKLMTLRIGSFAEGRTAAEDFLASARAALSGRPMSWEAFTNISQSFLSSQEKITSQPSIWKKYMSELFRASSKESKTSIESMETVLDVKKGRDIFRGSVTEVESLELSPEDSDWERRKEERRRRTKEKKELALAAAVKKDMSMASKIQASKKKVEREEKMAKKLAKEGKLATLKGKDMPLEKEQELLAKGIEHEVSEEKEYVLVRRKEHEMVKGKEQEEVRGKEYEAAKGKRHEAARGKEHEAAKGKEREAARREEHEATMEEEYEAARVKEREVIRAKEREAARRRREREATAERKDKEMAKKKLEKLEKVADEKREVLQEEKDNFLKEIDAKIESMLRNIKRKHGDETLLTDSERTLLQATESTIAEIRAEAKERMLAELKERALVEAQKVALEEVKERALAEAREMALEEARNWALLQAKKMSLIEAWEKALFEAREKAMEEVKEQALAEARERVLAESQEMALAEEEEEVEAIIEEKIQALVEVRTKELAEERAMEMALMASLEADEARILELVGAFPVEVDEARVFELAVARARELTEARAMELMEEKMMELSDAVIMELVEEQLLELVEAQIKEVEMEDESMAARQRIIARSKELISARKKLISAKKEEEEEEEKEKEEEEKEVDMWEDLEEESPWSLPEHTAEALISMTPKEPVSVPQLEFSERAQLILDVLTGPETLERKDSEDFQRLCQVVSLLGISSTTNIEGLAETLLQKAGETIQEGEEQRALLPEEDVSVLRVLKDTFRARQSWTFDPAQFASKLSGLLKAAETVLQAKKLKEKLDREFWKKCWEDRAKKTLEAGEMKIRGKKAWLGKKLKDAIRRWRVEQERAHWEKREQEHLQKRLKIRARPILLDVSEKEKDEESATEEEKAAAEEEKQKEELTTRRKPIQLTWSLTAQRKRAWKVIVQMEKQLPLSTEEQLRRHRPKGHRLPKESLYLLTKPSLKIHRQALQRDARQHLFRLDQEKGVDWDSFMNIYHSLMALKQEEGGMDSAAWHEQSAHLMDLYGTSNPLVRNMLQELLLGDRHDRKYVMGSTLNMRQTEADLGQRILYELIHHSARLRPRPPTIHGIIPLSYQNNVHPFKMRGTTRYGTLAFKWKTYMSRGKMPRLRLFVHSNSI